MNHAIILSMISAFFSLFFPEEHLDRSILCTDQKDARILLMDANLDWSRSEALLWQWRPDQDKLIKPEHRGWFYCVSDCKPVQGGKAILVTASGGGVALVDIASGKAVFYASAGGNPHSAELLPDGTIAAVSSDGNCISVFTRPDVFCGAEHVVKKTYRFEDAHGCVWDKSQKLLWVWGKRYIASFRYNGSRKDPVLTLEKTYHPGHGILPATAPECPDIPVNDPEFEMGGHDLYPVAGGDELYLTCWYGVMIFHPVTHTFRLFSDARHVKSISRNPVTGEVLYLVPAEEWWTDTVQTTDGKKYRLPGARFYKVRWFSRNSFSE